MKSFCLLIVLTLCAATYIVSAHSNNTTQPIFFHDVDDHGNSPAQPMVLQWVGVNIGGELFAMRSDEYLILAALTDIDGWQMVSPNNAAACGKLAVLICGEGQICCFCFTGNGQQSCSFSCQDLAGDCEPCPECGPDFASHNGNADLT